MEDGLKNALSINEPDKLNYIKKILFYEGNIKKKSNHSMGSLFKMHTCDKGFFYGTLTTQHYEDYKINGKTLEQMLFKRRYKNG